MESLSKRREPAEYKITDESFMKMKSNYVYPNSIVYGTLGPGISNINPSDYWYVDINNLYSPGSQNAITSFAMPVSTGYTQMNALYGYWKVRSCALSCTVTLDSPDVGGEMPDLHFAIVPMSDANNFAAPTISWAQWRLQPYFREVHIGPAIAGQKVARTIKHFISCGKIQGIDVINQKMTTTGTTGTSSTPPTQKPTFWCMMYAPNTSTSSSCRYSIELNATYYVEWSSRRMMAFSFDEDKKETLERTLVEDEKDAEEEGKEEKEYEMPGPPSTPKLPDLSTLSISSSSSSSKPWTCLNPSHPKMGHERVSTCK